MLAKLTNTLSCAVLGVVLAASHVHAASNDTSPGAPRPSEGWDFTWESIKPTPNLTYHRCFDIFECARLQVPLDYQAPSNKTSSETASIAIIKLASDSTNFTEYGPNWGGPVLINPGGPGGSGVDMVLKGGRELQQMVGPQFSIVGFDPRGINNTRPVVDCFQTAEDRIGWHMRGGSAKTGYNPEAISEAFVKQRAMGRACTEGKKSKELSYLGTASVARDMLAINEASWDLVSSGRRKGLQYWGFSYGSVLGVTFATLFPDKVERLIVDGVEDVFDYYSAAGMTSLQDTEAVMDSFYEFCFKAGPLKCKFHTGTSPSHIRLRLQAILDTLRETPLIYELATGGFGEQAEIFTYNDLRYLIFQALYSPLTGFPTLADGLVEIEQSLPGGYVTRDIYSGLKPALVCDAKFDNAANELLRGFEAFAGIFCADGPGDLVNATVADYREKVNVLKSQSPTIADLWGLNLLPCTGWHAQSKWKPTFPTSDEVQKTSWKGAAPILLIGNTADPVTPLGNAYTMAKLFPEGAAYVAVQEGEGHCSISIPSGCMVKMVQEYFATGVVPEKENDRYCQREVAPFIGELDLSPKSKAKRDIEVAVAKVGRILAEKLSKIRAG